ncbi:hypothetical protein GOV14_02065 [Candidatus Pacearchaeota archaeon]|nr:hypothetical protein [Candidatus Pacearchaeota archaeon]
MEQSQCFYVCDGQVLTSIGDLAGSLKHDMSDDAFKFHCNTDKNDFVNWISDVVGDKKLSKSLARIRTKKGMLNKIAKKK